MRSVLERRTFLWMLAGGFIGNSTAALKANLVAPWREGFLKTAKAIGLTIPKSLLLRTDQVLE